MEDEDLSNENVNTNLNENLNDINLEDKNLSNKNVKGESLNNEKCLDNERTSSNSQDGLESYAQDDMDNKTLVDKDN